MQLLIVDTAHIQPYIFGSNRLRENIGASYLVAQATGEWALERVPTPNNVEVVEVRGVKTFSLNDIDFGEAPLAAKVIYAGGGNLLILLQDDKVAPFVRELSRYVMQEAPGLQLVFAQQDYEWNTPLAPAVDKLFLELARQNRARVTSAPLLGSSVTVPCRATGLPAVDWTPRIKGDNTTVYPASAETLAKIAATLLDGKEQSQADRRLREMLKPAYANLSLAYPVDFDDLGRSAGEHSYIAVVHADGNSMGEHIRNIGKQYADPREYMTHLREFSDNVNRAAQLALQDTLQALLAQIDQDQYTITHETVYGDQIAEIKLAQVVDDQDNPVEPLQWYVPFRPIVYGGDDVTFVCDGRLGLSLALKYLAAFEQRTQELLKEKMTACAGIAIVKTHYPFARAYALAEELCRSAKDLCRSQNVSGLDWHFALSGLSGSIEDIRRREYTVRGDPLTLRPVTVTEKSALYPHHWSVIAKGVAAFQDQQITATGQPDWSARRNKVKALRDALRQGGTAVEHFRLKFMGDTDLPDVGWSEAARRNGWGTIEVKEGDEVKQQLTCGYFDAIELADWFMPLSKRANGEGEG
jgi:hypothetical protein